MGSLLNEFLEAVARDYADPPLCRVCGEPLVCGAVDLNGSKWAHYKVPEREIGAKLDHVERSTMINPPRLPFVAAMATELLALRRASQAGW